MEEKISIKKEYVLNAYQQASEEQKTLLENMFGKEMFQQKDIKERVKTFEDACEVLGEDHQYVKAYREWMRIYYAECKDITAYLKLRIICTALNDGWKPTFNGYECRYYTCFNIYTQDEYDEFDVYEKKECFCFGCSGNKTNANGGIVYASESYSSSIADSGSGSLLALKTKELAKYCEKQFIDIWADYLFA